MDNKIPSIKSINTFKDINMPDIEKCTPLERKEISLLLAASIKNVGYYTMVSKIRQIKPQTETGKALKFELLRTEFMKNAMLAASNVPSSILVGLYDRLSCVENPHSKK